MSINYEQASDFEHFQKMRKKYMGASYVDERSGTTRGGDTKDF